MTANAADEYRGAYGQRRPSDDDDGDRLQAMGRSMVVVVGHWRFRDLDRASMTVGSQQLAAGRRTGWRLPMAEVRGATHTSRAGAGQRGLPPSQRTYLGSRPPGENRTRVIVVDRLKQWRHVRWPGPRRGSL